MNRLSRVLLLASLVLATSAVGASAASAALLHSGSTSGVTYLTGTQIGTGTVDLENGTTVKCTSVIGDASFAGTTTSELTLTPTFSGCTAAGQTASVNMNGCQFTLTTPTMGANNDTYSASGHLVCNTGGDIVVNVPTAGCSVTAKAQTPAGSTFDITNNTTATANQDDITLKSTITGVAYTTIGGGICGASGLGKITGEATGKAYSNAAHTSQVDIWVL